MNNAKLLITMTLIASNSIASEITSKVNDIGSGWGADIACVYFDTGDIVRLDLTSEKAKLELTLSLSAKAMGQDMYVYFDDAKPLVGGCNTGTTVKQHSIMIMR